MSNSYNDINRPLVDECKMEADADIRWKPQFPGSGWVNTPVGDQCNFAGCTPEWSDSEAPAEKVTGV